jgi:zinc transporter, ZIP family
MKTFFPFILMTILYTLLVLLATVIVRGNFDSISGLLDPSTKPLLLAFLVTLGAGLATGIGSLLAFTKKEPSKKFLAFMLGLSAGVMIYVSLIEIFQKAVGSLEEATGSYSGGYLWATIGFFGGFVIIALIDLAFDKYYHKGHNHIEADQETHTNDHIEQRNLMRMGLFTALAIAIHNFPEGLATFIATLEEPSLGIAFAVAIAIHNIPEGISVAIPIYKATGSKLKAFWYSFISGLAEPVGAVIGYFVLSQFINEYFFGVVFAGVAGIMIYVALDELLPTAKQNDHHLPIIGVFFGMLIMASSLVLFVV